MLLHLIRDCSCSHAVDKIEIVNGHRIESCLINNTESVLSADKEGSGLRLPGEGIILMAEMGITLLPTLTLNWL